MTVDFIPQGESTNGSRRGALSIGLRVHHLYALLCMSKYRIK